MSHNNLASFLASGLAAGSRGATASACTRRCRTGRGRPRSSAAWPQGLAGALTNDSGPILFINAVVCLAALTAYILDGRPRPLLTRGAS